MTINVALLFLFVEIIAIYYGSLNCKRQEDQMARKCYADIEKNNVKDGHKISKNV